MAMEVTTMAAKKKTATKSAAPKAGTLPGINKSQFIRDHSHMSPAQIVEAGAKAGIKLTPQFVYSVRNAANRAAKPAGAPKGKPGRKPKILGGPSPSPSPEPSHPPPKNDGGGTKGRSGQAARNLQVHEQAMRDAVLDLGQFAAIALLDDVVARLRMSR